MASKTFVILRYMCIHSIKCKHSRISKCRLQTHRKIFTLPQEDEIVFQDLHGKESESEVTLKLCLLSWYKLNYKLTGSWSDRVRSCLRIEQLRQSSLVLDGVRKRFGLHSCFWQPFCINWTVSTGASRPSCIKSRVCRYRPSGKHFSCSQLEISFTINRLPTDRDFSPLYFDVS